MVWNFSNENIFACRSGEHNRWVPLLFFGIFGVLIAFCNKTNASLIFFYKGHHFSFCNIYGYGLACLFWKLIISVLKVLLSINVDLTHKYVPDITCNPSLLKKKHGAPHFIFPFLFKHRDWPTCLHMYIVYAISQLHYAAPQKCTIWNTTDLKGIRRY